MIDEKVCCRPFTLFWILLNFYYFIVTANGACFFPTELQGEFIMQSISMVDSQVQYSQVNITAEAIPIWGLCHRRIENNVILMDSLSGANCIRCFQLTLQSKNILQVKTDGLDKCYTTEEAAELTCPRDGKSNTNNLKEILLYKTKELGGEEIRKEYCPIHGKFTFVYNINDGSENKMECENYASQLDTCSSPLPASSLHLNFRSCSFSDHDITFVCLGDWQGPENQRYLALYDTRTTTQNRPQYRCALYHIDSATNNVHIAFSSDSTCSTNLVNSTSGFETLVLKPLPEPGWPPKVAASSGRLPSWTQGNWEHMSVVGHTITYRDHSRFQTLKIRVMGIDTLSSERYPVYIHDECGGESYNCIWLKKRGTNVLEFQLGIYPSVIYNDSVCYDANFQSKVWITQGRLERLQESPCPITGEYTGFIPGEVDRLCAKLSSDCKSPEIMYYTLSECPQKDVYEGIRVNGYRIKRESDVNSEDKIYRVTNPRSFPTSATVTEIYSESSSSVMPTTIVSVESSSNVPEITRSTVVSPFNSETRSKLSNITTAIPLEDFIATEVNKYADDFNKSFTKEVIVTTSQKVTTSPFPSSTATSVLNPRRNYFTTIASNYNFTRLRNESTFVTQRPDRFSTSIFTDYKKVTFDQTHPPSQIFTRTLQPVLFHGSVSEIPFQRKVTYNNFQRPNPDFNRGWNQPYRPVQERNRYVGIPPYPVRDNRQPDIRRHWPVHTAESHPVFVNHNSNVHKTPIALPPIQLPSTYLIPTNHQGLQRFSRFPMAQSIASSLREEREYLCLGQWEENGLTYTYTQRRDIGIYECFVGSIVSNNEIYIKEAGEHCERDVDPLHMGMKLFRRGACTETDPSPVPWDNSALHPYTQHPPSVTWQHHQHPTRQPHVTKPWKPITAPPRMKNEVLNSGETEIPFWLTISSCLIISAVIKNVLVFRGYYCLL